MPLHILGRNCWELSRTSNAPACLVLDIRLCGMSGLGLQEELAARDIRIPVIFVTGFGEISMVVQAMHRRGGFPGEAV